jgi:hypothetical protein
MSRTISDKKYSLAGTSVLNGERKIRFSNVKNYIADLKHKGHEDVELIELPEPMNKIDAVMYLRTIKAGSSDTGFELLVHDFMSLDSVHGKMKELGLA